MNSRKFTVVFLSGVLLLPACSTSPTSQSMGQYFGTALIIGGASKFIVDKDKTDAENKELTSDKKSGYGLMAAGFLVHYLINKAEESRKKEIQKKVMLDLKEREKFYKKIYTSKDIKSFLKYHEKTNYSISPYYSLPNYSNPNGNIKLHNSYLYLKIIPKKPYKTSFIDFPRDDCKVIKKAVGKNYGQGLQGLSDFYAAKWLGADRKRYETTIECYQTSNTIERTISFYKKIGVQKNILKEVRKRKTSIKFTENNDEFNNFIPHIKAIRKLTKKSK